MSKCNCSDEWHAHHEKCFVRPSDILVTKDAEIAALKEQVNGCCGDLLSTYGPEVIADAERQAKVEVLRELLNHVENYGEGQEVLNLIDPWHIRQKLKQLKAGQ